MKNTRSRRTCFWFNLLNVSGSGVGISYVGNGFIPFAIGDVLQLTVDLSSVIFARPIHLTVVVRRKTERTVKHGDNLVSELFLGAEILASDELHKSVWLEGLSTLGDPFQQDNIVPKKKA